MKMINLDYVEDVVIKKEVTTPANGTQSLTPLNIEKVKLSYDVCLRLSLTVFKLLCT